MMMDKNRKLILIVITGVIVSFLITFLFKEFAVIQQMGKRPDFELFLFIKVFVSTLNIVLLIILLWNYLSIYREIPNRFTLSLMIFSLALLLYALSSNPMMTQLMGFRHGVGLGPFTFLPDIFASVAVVILLDMSYE